MQKYLFLLLCCAIYAAPINGQMLKRQVLGSLGTPHTLIPGSTIYSASTVAQPPNAGTITNGTNCLRQGFQQPPISDPCPIAIQYDVSENTIPGCGTYYVFEYTGTITPTTQISWNFGSDASPQSATGPVSPNVAFYDKGNQEVLITVSDGSCMKTVTTMLNAQTAPFLVQVQTQNPYCYGSPGVINLTPSNGTPPYLVTWSNGAVTEDLQDLKPGSYAYTVTDQRGCKANDALTLVGSDQPLVIRCMKQDELCHDDNDGSIELTILNGAQPISYLWSDGSTDAVRTNLDSGYYKVEVTDNYGCVIDTGFQVKTFCDLEEEEFIPDTFSPNGDAANETWDIPILARFPNHTLDIYNRWGSVIFNAKGSYPAWDGVNNAGEKLPIGAYYYVISLNDAQKRIYKGSVTLVR
jgi:gliding motility-associated-like protein